MLLKNRILTGKLRYIPGNRKTNQGCGRKSRFENRDGLYSRIPERIIV